jgi:cell division GTPase FtsZ
MRIFAIGLGGAGCRIADLLYGQDHQFSKNSCVEAIAIDRDAGLLNSLRHIPVEKKIFFPSLSLNTDDISDDITIDEVLTRVHNFDTGDMDAIILCSGTGGTMIDVAIAVIPKIRATMVEPLFGLFTIPARDEGRRVSAKAAFDLERLKPLLDGIILFDNGIWSERAGTELRKGRSRQSHSLSDALKGKKPLPGVNEVYNIVNNGIARRLGLLLRAGEFGETGKMEIGEVVLDAGEILNTIRGMGFIAIGYSAADLGGDKYSIHRILRPSDYLVETGHKRASRLVDIAKEAIYENISIPCDMTSAQKALILVAGPSHEISMKGYMTVRKWIDRSIAGMEVRSGDYPVKTTHYIAIIIILAGISNIPRVREIHTIREDYTRENPDWISDFYARSLRSPEPVKETGTSTAAQETFIPAIIRERLPALTLKPPAIPPGREEEKESVRKIPFFGKRGAVSRQAEGAGAPPEVTVVTDNTSENLKKNSLPQEIKNPDNPIDASPGLYIAVTDNKTGSGPADHRVTDHTETKADTVKIGKVTNTPYSENHEHVKPDDGHNENLASIVAKAREDLKKTDKK